MTVLKPVIPDPYSEDIKDHCPPGGANMERVVEGEPIYLNAPETSAIPDRNTEDYPTLAAWYSGFAFAEHYRKVCLALCKEALRAKHAGEKITESRLEDLARTHPAYLDYLRRHLEGRTLWEAAFLQQGGMRV